MSASYPSLSPELLSESASQLKDFKAVYAAKQQYRAAHADHPVSGTKSKHPDYLFAANQKRAYFRSLVYGAQENVCGISKNAAVQCEKENLEKGPQYILSCIPIRSAYLECSYLTESRLNGDCKHLAGLMQRALYENEGQDRVDKFYTKLRNCLLTGFTATTKDTHGVEEIIFKRRKAAEAAAAAKANEKPIWAERPSYNDEPSK